MKTQLTAAMFLSLLLSLLPACLLGPLDVIGNDTTVTESESKSKEQKIEDDRIEDKHPVFDPNLTVTEDFDGCLVTLNKSGSVTKLDILPPEDQDPSLEGKIFPGRGEALAAVNQLPGADLIPSMEVVNGFMKPFNDGLYAAIELALQQGVEELLESKQRFLQELLDKLKEQIAATSGAAKTHCENAAVFIGAGLLLGGATVDLLPQLKSAAEQNAAAFIREYPIVSTPIGFYTWNATLTGIFRQDRYLQGNQLNTFNDARGLFVALAVVLKEDQALAARYEQILALYAGLTNPHVSHTPLSLLPYVDGLTSLEDLEALWDKFSAENPPLYVCDGVYLTLFPASRSKDTDYFEKTFCGAAPPLQLDLMEVLIQAIRDGQLDITPEADTGWYGYQLHALETLLLPDRAAESDHLLLTAAYKKKLIEAFKSILTQNRETHVKSLNMANPMPSMPTRIVDIYPNFQVEPFPTFYLRTARAYRFLATYLTGVLGEELLASQQRLYEDGQRSELPLGQELGQMTALLYGIYALASQSVGLDPTAGLLPEEQAEYPLETCIERAQSWLVTWQQDRDILTDPRVIVPILQDTSTKTNVYWAIFGVKVLKISANFVEGFEPQVLGATSEEGWGDCAVGDIVPHEYYLLMEQMQEVRIPDTTPPPTRKKFRQICDEHQTAEAIITTLEGLGQ